MEGAPVQKRMLMRPLQTADKARKRKILSD